MLISFHNSFSDVQLHTPFFVRRAPGFISTFRLFYPQACFFGYDVSYLLIPVHFIRCSCNYFASFILQSGHGSRWRYRDSLFIARWSALWNLICLCDLSNLLSSQSTVSSESNLRCWRSSSWGHTFCRLVHVVVGYCVFLDRYAEWWSLAFKGGQLLFRFVVYPGVQTALLIIPLSWGIGCSGPWSFQVGPSQFHASFQADRILKLSG